MTAPVQEPIPTPQASRPLLELEDVTIRFGGLTAVGGVSATVDDQELVGLIGLVVLAAVTASEAGLAVRSVRQDG